MTQQNRKTEIPTSVVAGKSLEVRVPDAPQQGRKLNPKQFFAINVVLNKTHGSGSPAGVFGVLGVSTAGKTSSSLIQSTSQVLISVSLVVGKETRSTCTASLPHQHLGTQHLQGIAHSSAQLSLHRHPGNTGIMNLPNFPLCSPQTSRYPCVQLTLKLLSIAAKLSSAQQACVSFTRLLLLSTEKNFTD